jgi:hypothetical protein
MPLLRVLIAGILATAAASAVPITYTFSVVTSGTIGATPFTNQTLTFSVTTDTTLIAGPIGTQHTPNFPVSGVSVSTPAGPTSITNIANVLAAPGAVGLTFGDIIRVDNPALATYDLSTFIGPITSTSQQHANTTVPTTLGNIVFSGGAVVFTASTTPLGTTPLPPSIILTLTGLACLGLYATRRKFARSN